MGAKPFRALAIDGGGMLGFYSAALLRALPRDYALRRKSAIPSHSEV